MGGFVWANHVFGVPRMFRDILEFLLLRRFFLFGIVGSWRAAFLVLLTGPFEDVWSFDCVCACVGMKDVIFDPWR